MRSLRCLAASAILLAGIQQAARAQPPKDYQDALAKGDLLAQRNANDQALDAYKKAYAISRKTSFDALMGMGHAYQALGRFKNVLDLTSDAMKLAGSDAVKQAQVHDLRGVSLVALAEQQNDKRLQEAEEEFRSAIADDPTFVTTELNLGITLLKQNRDEDGVGELKTFLAHAPAGPDTRLASRMIEDPRRAREALAPAFSFVSRDGQPVSLDGLAGNVVLIDFWGSWCRPCQDATPGLIALQKKYAERPVVFLGIARDTDPDWSRYLDKHKMPWPQFLDTRAAILRSFNVTGFPTYVVIDGEGVVRARSTGHGPGTEGWIERTINDILKKQPSK